MGRSDTYNVVKFSVKVILMERTGNNEAGIVMVRKVISRSTVCDMSCSTDSTALESDTIMVEGTNGNDAAIFSDSLVDEDSCAAW